MSSVVFESEAAHERMNTWYERVRADIPVPTSTHTVSTSFGDTHVLSAGPVTGPPLVIVHGAMASSALLMRELVHLTDRFRVHAVDVLGQSVKGADARLPVKGDAHGRWLGEVMDQLELPCPMLLGVSWGASWPCASPRRMNMTVPPLATAAELASLRAPVFVVAAEHDYSFPGERLLARAKELFPTLAHAQMLAGSKHSPPTTPAFRRELAAQLEAFFLADSQAHSQSPRT